MSAFHILFRTWLLRLLGIAAGTIVLALLSEWIIEIAKEQGLLDRPTERAEQAVSVVWAYVTQAWVLVSLALLAGLTAGAWIDYFLRLLDERVPIGRRARIKKFNSLHGEAIQHRNRVRHMELEQFDYDEEFARLVEWKSRMLPVARRINIDKVLKLENLDRFKNEYMPHPQENPTQFTPRNKIESMWNEYLTRLVTFADEANMSDNRSN